MGLFTLLARCWAPARRPRHASHLDARLDTRLDTPTLSPWRLERRRVLDAAGAGLVLGPLAGTSEFVQAGALDDNPTDAPPVAQSASSREALISVNSPPAITDILTFPDNTVENDIPIGLFVSFSDIDLADTHKVKINWGDLTPTETIVLDQGSRSLLTSHLYLDDNRTGTPVDTNTVQVTVTDSSDVSATGSARMVVTNVAPQIDFLSITSPVDENGVVQLEMTFIDQGILDTHTVEIDWDGNAVFDETIVLDPGARALATSHQYLDDNPTSTPSDTNRVVVKAIDDDMGSGMATRDVVVNNVAPTIDSLSITSPINENGTVELTGTFKDIGRLDTHTLTIDWDDPVTMINENGFATLQGTITDVGSLDIFTLDIVWGDPLSPANTQSFALGTTALTEGTDGINWDPLTRVFSLSHQYLDDNPSVSPFDTFTIDVTVTDDDMGSGMATRDVVVNNVAPTIDSLSITSPINENGFATLQGTITDVGSLDIFTLDIVWGDPLSPANTQSFALGTTALTEGTDGINWDPLTRVFSLSHQYLDDNPSVSPFDTFTIDVTVTDDDMGSGMATRDVVVNNVAPTIDSLSITSPINENGFATLQGTITDVGSLDIFTLDIVWGDPLSPANTQSFALGTTALTEGTDGINWDPLTRVFSLSHQYLDDNPSVSPFDTFTIDVTVTDDDMGSGMATRDVVVNNVAPTIDSLSITSPINENGFATLQGTITDVGSLDIFTLDIVWGDPLSPANTQSFALGTTALTEGTDGINWDPLTRVFSLSHQYLDDNPSVSPFDTFTIDVTVTDDDTGVGMDSITVDVRNEDPVVVLAEVTDVLENGSATLNGTFSDDSILDTHRLTVEWDDPNSPFDSVFEVSPILEINSMSGMLSPLLMVGDVLMSLTAGDPTELTITSIDADSGTVGFQATHQYLDDGTAGASAPGANGTLSDTSTIRVTVEDDDSGLGSSTATVKVINLNPVIDTLSVLPSSINESESFIFESQSVTLSGTFSDVGSLDFHSIDAIRWGDGLVDGEGGNLTFTQDISGAGSFFATHTYADNDEDNLYTITVTLTDDDGGMSETREIVVSVLNVDPVLEPIAQEDAMDVNSDGETSVTITFSDIGADELNIWVDWGDIRDPADPFLPGADPFVIETPTSITGAGTFTITLSHTYLGPPNPLSPTSDIEIFVVIVDDDFNFVAAGGQVDGSLATQPIVEPGRSEFQLVAISNPGLGTIPVRIDTTPQVSRLEFPARTESTLFFQTSTSGEGLARGADLPAAAGDTKATNERFLELRVISSSGKMGEGIRLKPEVLNDLPSLFGKLADNRYAIYLVRTETNTLRLVIDFFVRNGRAIDPGDDSEGTRDRPPAAEASQQDEASQQSGEGQPIVPDAEAAAPDDTQKSAAVLDWPADVLSALQTQGDTNSWSPLVGAAFVASSSYRNWAQQVDRTVAAADAGKWRRLRRYRPTRRKNQ